MQFSTRRCNILSKAPREDNNNNQPKRNSIAEIFYMWNAILNQNYPDDNKIKKSINCSKQLH